MVESLFLLLMLSAYTDLRKRLIHNWVSLLVFGISVLYAVTSGEGWLFRVVALPTLAFIVLFGGYLIGMMGGGDVKLLVALMPLIGFANLSQFALHTLLFGGLVALLVLIHSKVQKSRGEISPDDPPSVPYGVAIAAGTMTSEPMSAKILAYWGMLF